MDLAELLEWMHGAPESFRTLRGTLRTWSDAKLTSAAWARHADELRDQGWAVMTGGRSGFMISEPREDDEAVPVEEPEPESEEISRLWVRMPDAARLEDPQYTHVGSVAECRHRVLFAPLRSAAHFELEVTGTRKIAGRQGIVVRAVPREPFDPMTMFWESAERGSDERELTVDAELGFLLRRELRLAQRPFNVLEFTKVELDIELEDGLFAAEPPVMEEDPPQKFACSIEEAARAASFTVFVPAEVWPEARMGVSYSTKAEGTVEHAIVSYSVTDELFGTQQRLTLFQRRERDGDEDEGEDVTDLDLDEDPAVERRFLVGREGTAIEVSAQGAPTAEVIEILENLVPGRTGPPPGFD
jgi:hypothetical protein